MRQFVKLLIILQLLLLTGSEARRQTSVGRAVEAAPDGLTPVQWRGIRAAHEAWRREVRPTANGWEARNREAGLTASFDRRGLEVSARAGGWSWGLELESYGVGAQRIDLQGREAAIRTAGERISYGWDGNLEEWLVNEPRGFEHGFTLRERPVGGRADENLSLRLRIRGGLRPLDGFGGGSLVFGDEEGARLEYRDLVVRDAGGQVRRSWFEAEGTAAIRLVVEDGGAAYPLTIDPLITQQAYLKPGVNGADGYGDDHFGAAVAIHGETAVIGAPGERSSATGVDGNQSDNSANDSGAAYVFVRQGLTWSQQAWLKASNTAVEDRFGSAVAIYGDTIVVGALEEDSAATGVNGDQSDNRKLDAGAAYVFARSGTTWAQQAYLKASNTGTGDNFGAAVAIYGDTVVVGALNESSAATGVNGNQTASTSFSSGAGYVFVRQGTTWMQQAYLKASNTGLGDQFGGAVAIFGETLVIGAALESSGATGVNGNQADDSAFSAGAAYVFVRQGATWAQQAYLKASNSGGGDFFGGAVGIHGDLLVVGARYEGSVARSVNGDQADDSAPGAGAAYLFARSGATWSQQAYLKASNTDSGNGFGAAVAISMETVVIGARDESSAATGVDGDQGDRGALSSGAAYVFVRGGTGWSQQAYLKASNTVEGSRFGAAVAVAGETILVGADGEPGAVRGVNGNQLDRRAPGAGAGYIFVRSGAVWSQVAWLKASNTEAVYGPDYFGHAVAVDGRTVVVGAWAEDSAATGVDGNESDTSALRSGAAYVFFWDGAGWRQQAWLKASNTEAEDQFGWSVAISGETVLIGAPGEDGRATGVNGDQADNGIRDSGAVYVFQRSGTTWSQQAYLKASNTGPDDRFGWAVAIDGETAVVGAWAEDSAATGVNGNQMDNSLIDAGAAYVFLRSGMGWSQQAWLKASNTDSSDNFGIGVAIAGETIVVGAHGESSAATSGNGDQTDNSAPDAGAAYVFVRNGTTWRQQAWLKASNAAPGDIFGFVVAINGETIIVGAPLEDNDATGINGDQNGARAYDSGAAYVYVRNGLTWSQQAYLKASNTGANDTFGRAVAIHGGTVVIGADGEDSAATGVDGDQSSNLAPGAGAAYLFNRSGVTWSQTAWLKASNTGEGDRFGCAVAVFGGTIVVGAEEEDSSAAGIDGEGADNYASDTGAVYLMAGPVTLPEITGLTPATAVQGGDSFTLTVNGANFVSGVQLLWNGAARPTTFVSGSRIVASIGAADLAQSGTVPVAVLNPAAGGGLSNPLPFTITAAASPVPRLTQLTPATVLAGDAGFTLTVTGSGFTPTSRIEVNGSARPTTPVSTTVLTATISTAEIAVPGTLQISVRTPAPGGGLSNTLPLLVSSLPPSLTGLAPQRVIAGGPGLTLVVTGKTFFNGAVIRVNGQNRPTSFISDYQLSTSLGAADVAMAGTLLITVLNPGTVESAPLPLPVHHRVTSVSAASYATGEQARGSILAAFAASMASGVEISATVPLPTALRGTRVEVLDSAGVARDQSLFFVAPQQINYHLHPETAPGPAVVTVYLNHEIVAMGDLLVGTLSPAIFTQNATGDGVPAAYGLRVRGGETTAVQILAYDQAQARWLPRPLDPGNEKEPVYLVLFGTGFRANGGLGTVRVRIGQTTIPALYAGEAPGFIGLDQLNIGPLPVSLAGAGLLELTITIDGKDANPSKVLPLLFAAP
jgi:uncharacterized protein (TIGR03437 family)